jgi:hypothetical protein
MDVFHQFWTVFDHLNWGIHPTSLAKEERYVCYRDSFGYHDHAFQLGFGILVEFFQPGY